MVEKMGKLDRYIEVVWNVVKKDTQKTRYHQRYHRKKKGSAVFG